MNEFEVIAKVKEILKEYTEILSCNIKVYKRTSSIALTKINNSFICLNIHPFDSRIYLANNESIDSHFFKLGLKEGKIEQLAEKLEYLVQDFKWSGNKAYSEVGYYDASCENIKLQLNNFPVIKSCSINVFANRGIVLNSINNTPLSIYISVKSGIFLKRYFTPEQTAVMMIENDLKPSDIRDIEEHLKRFVEHIQHNNRVEYLRGE